MPYASVNNIQLHYQTYGDPSKKTLVLINGLGASSSSWAPQIDAFSFHYQVIILDNRGVGLTKYSTPFTLKEMASDIIELLKFLEIPKSYFLGTSMGGRICQEIAIQAPSLVDALVIASSTANPIALLRSFFIFQTYIKMLQMDTEPEIRVRYMLPWVFSSKFFEKETLVSDCIQSCLETEKTQTYDGYSSQLEAIKGQKTKAFLDKIEAPTLVFTGEDDLITPLEHSTELSELIPHSKLVTVEGGHGISQEYPEVYNHHILHFLASLN